MGRSDDIRVPASAASSSWTWRWKLLEKFSKPNINTRCFSSLHNISSQIISSLNDEVGVKPSNSLAATKQNESLKSCNNINVLTSQIVQSTLLNCPSDLMALSFFLWCARQHNYFHERTAFDHMVTVIDRLTQQFGTVERLIGQLESVGAVKKPQTLLLLLRIYWRGGMHNMVLETHEEMIKCGYMPNTFAHNIIMDVLFKIGWVNKALEILKEIRVPNYLSFSIAVCNLCRLNDLTSVKDVLRNMLRKRYYLNAELFLMVLKHYCKMRRLSEALQLLALMITAGIPLSVYVWSILIDGFCKFGNLDTASCLLEKMANNGCHPNVVTCTSLIKGFMESRNIPSALNILCDLESRGCSPDLVLANVLIDRFSKLGRYDDALDVYFSFPKRNLIPDSYTFCSLTTLATLSEQFDLLPLLISGIQIKTDLVMCNSLLNYYCKARYPSGAVGHYNDMLEGGFVPDQYTYAGLLSGLCGVGKVDEAVNVYYGIVRSHFSLDAHIHTLIINALIKYRKFHRAIRIFREAVARNYQLDVVSYTVAIHGLLRSGRFGEAYTLYGQMKAACLVPNAHTYRVMLCGFCGTSDVDVIIHVLRDMVYTKTGLDWSTFNKIRRLSFNSQQLHTVYNIFIELLHLGLMSSKATEILLTYELAHTRDSCDANCCSSKSNIMDVKDASLEMNPMLQLQ